MWKCGNYIEEVNSDCHYKDNRCCWYCDKKDTCEAKSRCWFDCYNDGNTNEKEDTNAYWEE